MLVFEIQNASSLSFGTRTVVHKSKMHKIWIQLNENRKKLVRLNENRKKIGPKQ